MIYNGVELYEKDGKIGVLVSPGFGAGWSTWNCPQLAYDKRVIEYWMGQKGIDLYNDEMMEKVESQFSAWGYGNTYFGGYNRLKLKWVAKGEPFQISEYDGFEELKVLDMKDYIVFS